MNHGEHGDARDSEEKFGPEAQGESAGEVGAAGVDEVVEVGFEGEPRGESGLVVKFDDRFGWFVEGGLLAEVDVKDAKAENFIVASGNGAGPLEAEAVVAFGEEVVAVGGAELGEEAEALFVVGIAGVFFPDELVPGGVEAVCIVRGAVEAEDAFGDALGEGVAERAGESREIRAEQTLGADGLEEHSAGAGVIGPGFRFFGGDFVETIAVPPEPEAEMAWESAPMVVECGFDHDHGSAKCIECIGDGPPAVGASLVEAEVEGEALGWFDAEDEAPIRIGERNERDGGAEAGGRVDELAAVVREGEVGVGVLLAEFEPEFAVEEPVAVPDFGDLGEVVGVDVREPLEIARDAISDAVAVLRLEVEEKLAVVPPAGASGVEFEPEAEVGAVGAAAARSAADIAEVFGRVGELERGAVFGQARPKAAPVAEAWLAPAVVFLGHALV